MTYTVEAARIGREYLALFEADLDLCANIYGVADSGSTCTAGIQDSGTAQAGSSTTITLATTASTTDNIYNTMTVRITGGTGAGQERIISAYVGSTKVATVTIAWTTNPDATSTYKVIDRPNACYNTYGNCQDRTNYVKTTKTYKFCTKSANVPIDQGYIPCIDDISTAPSKILPGKSLGSRVEVSVQIKDFPHHDRGFDPYFTDRTWYPNADQRGTFFGKFKARNKYYNMRDARIRYGFISPNGFDINDFQTHYYVIESMEGPDADDNFNIKLADPIRKANYDRAQCPVASKGKLLASITDVGTSATITPTGYGDLYYPASGYIAIDNEIASFTRSGDVLTLTRAQYGTTGAAHNAGTTIQLCYSVSGINVIDIIYDLLVNYAGISSTLIPYSEWTQEKTDYLSIYNLTTIVEAPVGVSDLLTELIIECGLLIAWDEQNQKIILKAVRSGMSVKDFTDSKLIKNSIVAMDKPVERLSQIWYSYDYKNPFNRSGIQDFNTTDIYVDDDAEGVNKYGEARQEKIYSRWVNANGIVVEVASRKLKRYKENPIYMNAKIDIRDSVNIGDFVSVLSDRAQDESGSSGNIGFQVVSVRNIEKYSKQELELFYMPFNRYGLIGPNSLPDYTSATQAQKDTYAWICDTSTLQMSNGDECYVIQ